MQNLVFYEPRPTTLEIGRDDSRMTGRIMQRELVLVYRDVKPLWFLTKDTVSIASKLGLPKYECTAALSLHSAVLIPAEVTDLPSSIILQD